MNLIHISDDVLINPEYISTVEVRNIKGKKFINVTCDGKKYILGISINEFLKQVNVSKEIVQYFAG